MTSSRKATGLTAIATAIAFNIPFSILASTFSYPDILRRPAAEVLSLFSAGGPALVLTWYAFMLAALLLIPMSVALSISSERLQSAPGRAIGAAISGSLAGITQAIGLSRWIFVVPTLAVMQSSSDASAQQAGQTTFTVLNQYGGVAIGEHLGQLLTALFVAQLSSIQWNERKYLTALAGLFTTISITLGAGEGLTAALGQSGDLFSKITVAGYLGLTAWLIMTGIGLLLPRKALDSAPPKF
ncbi:MAG: DUF4386 family protein [Micropepsaceae bacterium]